MVEKDVVTMTETTTQVGPWRYSRELVQCVWHHQVAFVVFVYLATTIAAAVNPDGEALLAFKAALQDPTGILNSWSASDANPCLWNGVTCNTNLRVQRLLLQDTQLAGPISPALRNLTELRTLVLSRNNFSGALPPELSQIGTHLLLENPMGDVTQCWGEMVAEMASLLLVMCRDVVEA